MAGVEDNSKAEEWLNEWMTPAEALALVTEAMGSEVVAAEAIVDQLKDGFVLARARSGLIAPRDEPEKKAAYPSVPDRHWKGLGSAYRHHFWKSAAIEVWSNNGNTRIAYNGIRLDPAAIGQVAPPAPRTKMPEAPSASPSQIVGEREQKAPAVSQAALDAWLVSFQAAYKGGENTLAKAYESAEGMFPGKFVARQRIRDLLKGRTVGRKPKTAK